MHRLDEFFKAAAETSESIRESPTVGNGQKNAFVTRHGKSLFDFYKQYPKRSARFASAMAGVSRRELEAAANQHHCTNCQSRETL